MAHLSSGILGHVSGKVGNMVFYIIKGQNFVRSMPRQSDKPATEKQLIQRAKFGAVQKFLSPIAQFLNRANPKVRRMSAANMACRQIINSALTGVYPMFQIDYSSVELLRGSLAYPYGSMLAVSSLSELALCWKRPAEYMAAPDDELLIMMYCPQLGLWYKPDNPFQRADHGCFVKIPAIYHNKDLHVWIAFRSSNHRNCSYSQYLGLTQISSGNFNTTNSN